MMSVVKIPLNQFTKLALNSVTKAVKQVDSSQPQRIIVCYVSARIYSIMINCEKMTDAN